MALAFFIYFFLFLLGFLPNKSITLMRTLMLLVIFKATTLILFYGYKKHKFVNNCNKNTPSQR